MTALYFIAFLLLSAGVLLFARLSPLELISSIPGLFPKRKVSMKRKILQSHPAKKPKGIRKAFHSIQNLVIDAKTILAVTNRSAKFASLCTLSLAFLIAGIFVASLMGNAYMMPVLAVGFALIPFLYTQREYKIAKMLLQLRDSSAMPQRFDYEQAAAQWLEKAANDGNAYAAFEAARLLEQNPYSSSDTETICFYYQLALTGFYDLFSDKTTASDTRARLASKIARMYLKGNGTIVREDEAFRWFSKAAELGDLSAQYQIGKMLLDGTGCDMDGNEAFRIFIDAAIRGNVFAQYQVGKMFENGIGTAKDSFQSEYWFRTAAANGNEAAQNHLNYLKHQKDYDAQTVVGSFLRMLGSGINDRIEDSTTHRFGPDRKAMKKRRQQKAALGQKEDELDEVM